MNGTKEILKKIYDDELAETVFEESTAALYKGLPSSASATIIIATFLASVLWDLVDHQTLMIWFPLIVLINLARLVLYKAYCRRDKNLQQTKYWDRLFYFFLILSGLSLSCVSIWLLPETGSVYHYFPEMILVGMTAGAVSSLSYSMRNITTYFILLLVPLFTVEMMIATSISYSVSGLVFLLAYFALANAKRFNQTAVENFKLQFESEKHNQELIESELIAREANNAKGKFISLMSHELRTPLNAILGYTQLIRMSDSPPLNEEQDEQSQGILDSGTYLLSLIEELLDLSKIEANKVEMAMENVSVANVLNETVTMLNHLADDENVKLVNNVENKYLISTDSKRLKQVFINLISNAIKYNKKGGSVTITAEIPEDNRVRVSVIDDGYGLTKEQQFDLFKPFQRFDTRKEGIGLGLYIVFNLVEIMGGEIGVESEHEKGSTFWVEFELLED